MSDEKELVGTVQDSDVLKPVHILVMVITLLHAVAIAVWLLVILPSSKQMGDKHPPRGPAANPRSEDSKKTQ